MQEFCKALCKINEVGEENSSIKTIQDETVLPAMYHDIALNSGRPLFEKLAKGPRQRSDRKSRILKNGMTTDIYGVIMEALVQMKPGIDSINYEILRGYIKDVLVDDLPQMHEVSRVLDKIAEISFNSEASTPVIDWDKNEGILTITDPFFAFYLRWKDLKVNYVKD